MMAWWRDDNGVMARQQLIDSEVGGG